MFVSRRVAYSDWYWKRMHDPNKFKNKYAKRKGWQYAESINHSTEHLHWSTDGGIAIENFPYNIGFDSAKGPIRHRDFRSSYFDVTDSTIVRWYENPKSDGMQKTLLRTTQDNDVLYRKIYDKIGPRIHEYVFPFKLGDLVELVAGRDKGNRGYVSYINELHNYILVGGCNIDYSIDATMHKKSPIPPMEAGLLPEHIRLVNPEDTTKLVEEVEFVLDHNDNTIIRRCKETKTLLKWLQDGDAYVNAGGLVHCKN